MKKSVILFIVLFGLIDQISSNGSKSNGIISKERLDDYDVKKKVIFTPVSNN